MKNLKKIGGIAIVLCSLMVAAVAQDKKDATGTWTWSRPGRNGGNPTEITLKIKKEGDKMTGTMSGGAGRGGAAAADVEVKDLKVTGDQVSFAVERPGRNGGDPQVTKYSGKLSGDTITGKMEGGRGNAQPTDWEAKRKDAKDAKPAADKK